VASLIIGGPPVARVQVRKLQTTAGGTFIVTVPKEWVEKLGLKKGDFVSTEMEEDSLVLTPTDARHVGESRTLDVDRLKDKRLLELNITASYIQGHDVTRIFSSGNKMQPHHKEWIRETLDGLMGVEITEDYADHVSLLNLIDPTKFSPMSTIEQFSSASLAVLEDATKALEEGDASLAKDANIRGAEGVKLYNLVMRLAFQAARNRKLRERMNISDVSSVIVMAIATRELGRIAYYATWIAQHVMELTARPDPALVSVIRRMTDVTVEMQRLAMKALLSRDIGAADAVFRKMPQVRQLYESGYRLPARENEERDAYHLALILRDIRGIAGYAVALADDAVLGMFR